MRTQPFSLDPADQAALERALTAAAGLVRRELEATDGGPWAAAAIYVWDQEPALLPATMGLCSVAERERAAGEGDPERRESYAWVPAEWGALGEFGLEYDEPTAEAGERLAAQLDDETGEVPAWVAGELCRRLMASELPNVTPEFVVYPFAGHDDGTLLSDIEELAPADVRSALAEARLLPGPPAAGALATPAASDDLVASVVDAVADRLEGALEPAHADGPWPAMAVLVRTDGGVLPESLKLCPPARRAKALALRLPGSRALEIIERLETAWVDDWWHPTSGEPDDDGWGDVVETRLEWPADVDARSREAEERLRRGGEADPASWVVNEACRRLNRRRPANTTADFVAYAHESTADMAVGIAGSVLAAGTPEVVAALVEAGLLVESVEKLRRLY